MRSYVNKTLPAKLKKTTLQTKDRIDKLKIKKQKQDFRVNGSCSLSYYNYRTLIKK